MSMPGDGIDVEGHPVFVKGHHIFVQNENPIFEEWSEIYVNRLIYSRMANGKRKILKTSA